MKQEQGLLNPLEGVIVGCFFVNLIRGESAMKMAQGVIGLLILTALWSGSGQSSTSSAVALAAEPKEIVKPVLEGSAPVLCTDQAITRLQKARARLQEARQEIREALGDVSGLLREKKQEKARKDQDVSALQRKLKQAQKRVAFMESEIKRLQEEINKTPKVDVEKVTVQVTINGRTVTKELSPRDAKTLQGLLKPK